MHAGLGAGDAHAFAAGGNPLLQGKGMGKKGGKASVPHVDTKELLLTAEQLKDSVLSAGLSTEQIALRHQKDMIFATTAATLASDEGGPTDDSFRLIEQLLDIIAFYETFEVDDMTGKSLSRQDLLQSHYDAFNKLRKVCFDLMAHEKFQHDEGTVKKLRTVALGYVGRELLGNFRELPTPVLRETAKRFCHFKLAAFEREIVIDKKTGLKHLTKV